MTHFLLIFEQGTQVDDLPSEFEVFPIEDHIILVATSIEDAAAIKILARIGEDGRAGAVLKLNGSYSGYYYKDLWEWMKNTREATVAAY